MTRVRHESTRWFVPYRRRYPTRGYRDPDRHVRPRSYDTASTSSTRAYRRPSAPGTSATIYDDGISPWFFGPCLGRHPIPTAYQMADVHHSCRTRNCRQYSAGTNFPTGLWSRLQRHYLYYNTLRCLAWPTNRRRLQHMRDGRRGSPCRGGRYSPCHDFCCSRRRPNFFRRHNHEEGSPSTATVRWYHLLPTLLLLCKYGRHNHLPCCGSCVVGSLILLDSDWVQGPYYPGQPPVYQSRRHRFLDIQSYL